MIIGSKRAALYVRGVNHVSGKVSYTPDPSKALQLTGGFSHSQKILNQLRDLDARCASFEVIGTGLLDRRGYRQNAPNRIG